VASLWLCAPSLFLMGYCQTLVATRAGAAVFGLGSGLFIGNIFAATFEIVPFNMRASSVGMLNLFGSMLSGCATLLGGVWKKSLGIDGMFTLASFFYAAASLVLVIGINTMFLRDCKRIH